MTTADMLLFWKCHAAGQGCCGVSMLHHQAGSMVCTGTSTYLERDASTMSELPRRSLMVYSCGFLAASLQHNGADQE